MRLKFLFQMLKCPYDWNSFGTINAAFSAYLFNISRLGALFQDQQLIDLGRMFFLMFCFLVVNFLVNSSFNVRSAVRFFKIGLSPSRDASFALKLKRVLTSPVSSRGMLDFPIFFLLPLSLPSELGSREEGVS